jgi:class 3 adenylate cyclase
MIDAAHRCDGYIVQSTGHGIFALFGAPVAHEDHPLPVGIISPFKNGNCK